MSEETFVQLFWTIAVVVGFIGSLIVMAWVSDLIRRSTRHRWPEWDWTAEAKRRITDRARNTRAGMRE